MHDDTKVQVIKKWLQAGSINIFGKPFAGKDSQGAILTSLLNGRLLGGGDILRSCDISEGIKHIMSAGQLIPSDEYVRIVLPFLSKPELADKPLILSSVGRWDGEQVGVMSALNQSGHNLKAVVYIDIPDDIVYKRWAVRDVNKDRPNRRDDTKEIIDIRLSEFQTKTTSVIDYYRKIGYLIEINGQGTREKVANDIIDSLYQQLQ
jgi:adenylate kinase